jgi:hypothetical protein
VGKPALAITGMQATEKASTGIGRVSARVAESPVAASCAPRPSSTRAATCRSARDTLASTRRASHAGACSAIHRR